MNRDDIIKMAQDSGFSEAWLSAGENPPHFEAPAVIVERFFHMAQAAMIEQGWRQCAKGQRTTQCCGMVEQAVQEEREACAQIVENEACQYASPVWAVEIVNDIRARGNE